MSNWHIKTVVWVVLRHWDGAPASQATKTQCGCFIARKNHTVFIARFAGVCPNVTVSQSHQGQELSEYTTQVPYLIIWTVARFSGSTCNIFTMRSTTCLFKYSGTAKTPATNKHILIARASWDYNQNPRYNTKFHVQVEFHFTILCPYVLTLRLCAKQNTIFSLRCFLRRKTAHKHLQVAQKMDNSQARPEWNHVYTFFKIILQSFAPLHTEIFPSVLNVLRT